MKAIIEKKVEIKRRKIGFSPCPDYIGMEKRVTTVYLFSIPIFKRTELFFD